MPVMICGLELSLSFAALVILRVGPSHQFSWGCIEYHKQECCLLLTQPRPFRCVQKGCMLLTYQSLGMAAS